MYRGVQWALQKLFLRTEICFLDHIVWYGVVSPFQGANGEADSLYLRVIEVG